MLQWLWSFWCRKKKKGWERKQGIPISMATMMLGGQHLRDWVSSYQMNIRHGQCHAALFFFSRRLGFHAHTHMVWTLQLPKIPSSKNTGQANDKIVGTVAFFSTVIGFLYYSTWTLIMVCVKCTIMPFIETHIYTSHLSMKDTHHTTTFQRGNTPLKCLYWSWLSDCLRYSHSYHWWWLKAKRDHCSFFFCSWIK